MCTSGIVVEWWVTMTGTLLCMKMWFPTAAASNFTRAVVATPPTPSGHGSVCVLKVVLCDVHYYCKSKARVPKLFPLNLEMYVGPKRIPSSHKWMTSFSNLCSEKSNISTSLLETPGGPNWILWQVNLNMSACWEMHLIAILPGVGWEEWIHSHVLYLLWCYSHPTSLA